MLSENYALHVPQNVSYARPGKELTFKCTASDSGRGFTVWSGSAFSCSGTANDIHLRHSQFSSGGAFGSCNDGNIMARSVEVANNCFTSQLTVQVSTTLNNTTIKCSHDSANGSRIVGISTINVVTGKSTHWKMLATCIIISFN